VQASTSSDAFDALAGARHSDPFSVLGPHVEGGRLTLRAFNPSAAAIDVVHDGNATPMARVHPGGGFEATFPVVCRLVDRRFFGFAADRYIHDHLPAGPCLFEYGGTFIDAKILFMSAAFST